MGYYWDKQPASKLHHHRAFDPSGFNCVVLCRRLPSR
jgi:hypothetical protein